MHKASRERELYKYMHINIFAHRKNCFSFPVVAYSCLFMTLSGLMQTIVCHISILEMRKKFCVARETAVGGKISLRHGKLIKTLCNGAFQLNLWPFLWEGKQTEFLEGKHVA